jgi:hypothetical protein
MKRQESTKVRYEITYKELAKALKIKGQIVAIDTLDLEFQCRVWLEVQEG